MQNNQTFALKLHTAADSATATEQLSHAATVSIEAAYDIQARLMTYRYERGEQLVGLKLGFTSKAKMEQMGVQDMIWGRLTDAMHCRADGKIERAAFIHPRAEPEIAFLIKTDLPENLTLADAPQYIEGVAVAVEVIDSRYQNFKFSLADVIADNCSSAAFAIGEWHTPDTPINYLAMALWIDEKQVETGTSDAILGNPWESVVAAARLSHQYNEPLKKGMILLAGAATSAVFIEAGQTIKGTAEGLGEVKFGVF
jgi:2-keto-4-pentenoate hydratase